MGSLPRHDTLGAGRSSQLCVNATDPPPYRDWIDPRDPPAPYGDLFIQSQLRDRLNLFGISQDADTRTGPGGSVFLEYVGRNQSESSRPSMSSPSVEATPMHLAPWPHPAYSPQNHVPALSANHQIADPRTSGLLNPVSFAISLDAPSPRLNSRLPLTDLFSPVSLDPNLHPAPQSTRIAPPAASGFYPPNQPWRIGRPQKSPYIVLFRRLQQVPIPSPN